MQEAAQGKVKDGNAGGTQGRIQALQDDQRAAPVAEGLGRAPERVTQGIKQQMVRMKQPVRVARARIQMGDLVGIRNRVKGIRLSA